MVNNYWFEIAAFILELAIGYMLLFRKTITLPYNGIFRKLYTCSLIASFCALVQVLLENYIFETGYNISDYSIILNVLSMAFFYAHVLCSVFAAFYECSVLNIKIEEPLTKFLLYAPAIVAIVTITLNPLFHTIFYISPVSGYQRKLLLYLLYLVAIYYFVLIIAIIRIYGQNIRNDKRIAFLVLPCIPAGGTIFQFLFPHYAVESFFMALLVLITYITIESPSDYIDFVTGLQNKNAFYANFSVAMSMKKPVTVITLTIERIEAWEKELGKERINALILDVSIFLNNLLKNAAVYSIGRGKFAICITLENTWANIHMAEIVADKIIERFESPFEISDTNKISLIKHICIYNCPNDIDNANVLEKAIEAEATAVPPIDKNYITIENINMSMGERERLIASEIHNVFENSAFSLAFLPEYNSVQNTFDSIKTELSLNTSKTGYVNSRTLIAVAEKYGLIISFYNYVLESLFQLIRDNALLKMGLRSVEIVMPLSILLKKNKAEKLVNLAAKYDIPPKLICFELDKNTMLDYDGIIVDNMKAISNAGFRFILESYGNGYTNAASLVDMPICAVTVDKLLTNSALDSDLAHNIMRSTVSFLKEFNLLVKAEHIETEHSKDYALQLGCDYLQGYYFSHPLDVVELADFFKKGGKYNEI